ncbi:MAG: hypothetical protein ABEI39_00345 [Halobacteriales archaeon]
MTRLYDRVADLPVRVEGYDLERHERETSAGFTRVTTEVAIHGDGETGRGEDVTYEAGDHDALRAAADPLPLDGEDTLDAVSAALDRADLFPEGPSDDAYRRYRRWAVESAALDLGLRQAGTDLATALGRTLDPVRFVVSTRLGEPPSADRIHEWLDIDPRIEFKLDAEPGWDRALIETLADTGRVRIVDLKGHYEGTDVDTPADPDLYRRVIEGFPDALIEDPLVTGDTRPVVAGARERLAWDLPITDAASLDGRPWPPAWVNVKPSRFGSVEALLDCLEACAERGIGLYGGGQYELGAGRGQLHVLAALFYPDGPNDVAPGAYNDPEPRAGLPASPLDPPADPAGFRWP